MKKHSTKLLVLFLALILFNCQQEDDVVTPQNEVKSFYKQNSLKLSEIPEIKNFVITKTNPEVFSRAGEKGNQVIFDIDNILEVIDTLDNANYSFQFRFPETPIGDFYNLIVPKSPTGEIATPFVLKLSCDKASLEQYIAGGFNFQDFKGTMAIHKYTDFFEIGSFSRTMDDKCPEEFDEYGDPVPCDIQPIDGGSGGGGEGPGDTPGGTTGSGSTAITSSGGSSSCGYAGMQRTEKKADCLGNCFIMAPTWICEMQSMYSRSNAGDDCPECEISDGGIGINTDIGLSAMGAMKNINECLDMSLTIAQINWLIDDANQNSTFDLNNYLDLNKCSAAGRSLALDFLDITSELPNAKYKRYKELMDLIANDPWVIIKDCAQQNGLDIANYQQLYNHTLPPACTDRLVVLGNNFQDQPLNTGNAAVANVDYYGVEITTSPDINEDGNPDTDAEVFQAYKETFSSLASGGKDDFEFSCNNPFGDNFGDVSWTFLPYFANDVSIWDSSNPLTVIFKIDASAEEIPFGDFISDDGAIMISKFTPNYWIGSTIATEFSGTQPFSGNRQWGFITNSNGNLELYARAVDVARVSNLVKNWTPGSDECKEDSYYNIGEATWSNLQEEIKQFIIDNGGQAQVVPKTAIRFDKEKIKELLESNESIDQIPCN